MLRSTVQYRRTSSFERLRWFLRNMQMKGMINTDKRNNDCGILLYPIILAANKGEGEAMKVLIQDC